jgi:hypothetical protein
MIFEFYLKGELVDAGDGISEADAAKNCGLVIENGDYDKAVLIPEEKDLAVTDTSKTRKPRADKGQPRKKDIIATNMNTENPNGITTTVVDQNNPVTEKGVLLVQENPKPRKKKATKKDRKHPEYFVLDEDGILSQTMTHDEALKFIEDSNKDTIRVIMGHEIHFTRKVQFKMS